jgi:hypothetical protein
MAACSYCRHVLADASIAHTPIECPYRRSMYCTTCNSYGHIPVDCPNKRAAAIRQGLDVDALGIQNVELRVPDAEAAIRTLLRKHGVAPAGSVQANRRLLHELANSLTPPRMVIYLKLKKNEVLKS